MIPYVIVPPFRLGPLTLQPFGLLVAVGVGIGWAIVVKRGKALGFLDANVQSFLWWMCTGGFVGGHVFDAILYHPREVLENPLTLVMLWAGLSSFGGFAGATLGGLAWKYFYIEPLRPTSILNLVPVFKRRQVPMPLLPYADLMIAAFPISWIFGRTGCAIVHDHPGAHTSNHWFAVAYGPGPTVDYGWFLLRHGSAPRYDLGLLELFITLFIALGFALGWKRGKARGYFLVAASLVYAPIRFGLDFLRATDNEGGDPRYAGFTPAQWACIALAAYGFWLLRYLRSRSPITP